MEKLRSILGFILIIAGIIVSEIIRQFYGIPVTILDLLLLPLFLLFIIFGVKHLASSQKMESYDQVKENSTKQLLFSLIVGVIIMVPLGAFSFWYGLKEPLEVFSGVKGSIHGYTLIVLGVFILGTGGYIIFKSAKELHIRLVDQH